MAFDSPADAVPRPTIVQQAFVLCFVLGLGALIARTHLLDDDRYGYSMFRYLGRYEVRMEWIFADGHTERHVPQKDMHRRVRILFTPGWHAMQLGLGAVRGQVREYARYQWRKRRPRGAVQLHVALTHTKYDGPRVTDDIYIPERARR